MTPMHLLDATLDSLHDGRVFQKVFSIALIVGAVAAAIGVALAIFGVLGLGLSSFTPAEMKLGAILIAACLAAMGLGCVNVMMYHSRHLAALDSTAFVLAQIGCSMIQMVGELYAVVMTGIGAGALLGSLFGASQLLGQSGMNAVPGLPIGALAGGGGGAFAAFICALLAFLGLAGSYWLAEVYGALFDIAVNVRKLAKVPGEAPAVGASASPAPAPTPAVIARPAPAPTPRPIVPAISRAECPSCGAPTIPGQPFCTECGMRLV